MRPILLQWYSKYSLGESSYYHVWQEYAQSSYGTLFAQSGPEDTLIIDSINFIQSQSSQYIREVSFLANKEDFISQATADSCYLISYPNSNFSGEVKNRKIILFNGDAIRLSQFNFSYTINNVYEGDTLTVVLCFLRQCALSEKSCAAWLCQRFPYLKKNRPPRWDGFQTSLAHIRAILWVALKCPIQPSWPASGGKEFFMARIKAIISSLDRRTIKRLFRNCIDREGGMWKLIRHLSN